MSNGFRKLISKQADSPISESQLKEYLLSIFHNLPSPKKKSLDKYPIHYVWEEDGEQYSMWQIAPGILTGAKGFELYQQALQKHIK